MCPFYQEETPNSSKRCNCLASALKDAFSNCHTFRGRLSTSSPLEDDAAREFDEEEEVFVSAVISKYVESKSKRKASHAVEGFSWAFSPTAGDLFVPEKPRETTEDEENESFFDAGSHFSPGSIAASIEAFVSVQATFSCCSSLNRLADLPCSRRRLIMEDFHHCEGWPFGLCRKALLLPPLPKSPSDSWSWRKNGRSVKVH